MDEFPVAQLHYEHVEIGQKWCSQARTITETDVVNFANITGDYNPLHLDHEFASTSHYRRPIAHGLLGLSWVAGLSAHTPTTRTLAFVAVREWEFLRPLYFGDTVHVITEVLDKQPSGRRAGKIVWSKRLVNQRGELVQQGVFETLVSAANPLPRTDQSWSPEPHVRHSADRNSVGDSPMPNRRASQLHRDDRKQSADSKDNAAAVPTVLAQGAADNGHLNGAQPPVGTSAR